MISFVLAALLARNVPAATITPAPAPVSAMPVAATTSAPQITTAPDDVVIENSGSTNTLGYRLVVHANATVDVAQAGTTTRKSVTHARAADLLAAVRAAAPLDEMTSARCMHSASFGSITRVTYGGKTSSDLGCGASPAGQRIATAASAVVAELDLQRFRTVRMPLGGPGLAPHSAASPGP